MGLEGFITTLVVSVVVAGALHYGAKYYVTEGTWSFVSKCVVGYLGAHWGTLFVGSWGFAYAGVAIIPAAIGAAALIIVLVDVVKIWIGRSS